MTNEFENFNDRDEEWLRELELRATDLENDLFDWREAHARELADSSYGRDGTPPRSVMAAPACCAPSPGQHSLGGRRPRRSRRWTSRTTQRHMPSRKTSPTTS